MSLRLNKLLSRRGIGARRKCDLLIQEGHVRVNGRLVTEPGTMVEPESDRVEVDRRPLPPPGPTRYFVLNKPVGVISTLDDPEGRRSLQDLLPPGPRVFPVGRLDSDTSGLLVLTNDGELAHKLMHPRYGVEKVYRVWTDRPASNTQLARLGSGVEFEPGIVSEPARVRALTADGPRGLVEIAIHEGRYRQVRRMFEAVGLTVVGLHRSAYGPLRLGPLSRGMWRELSAAEVNRLREVPARPRGRTRPIPRSEYFSARRGLIRTGGQAERGGERGPRRGFGAARGDDRPPRTRAEHGMRSRDDRPPRISGGRREHRDAGFEGRPERRPRAGGDRPRRDRPSRGPGRPAGGPRRDFGGSSREFHGSRRDTGTGRRDEPRQRPGFRPQQERRSGPAQQRGSGPLRDRGFRPPHNRPFRTPQGPRSRPPQARSDERRGSRPSRERADREQRGRRPTSFGARGAAPPRGSRRPEERRPFKGRAKLETGDRPRTFVPGRRGPQEGLRRGPETRERFRRAPESRDRFRRPPEGQRLRREPVGRAPLGETTRRRVENRRPRGSSGPNRPRRRS